MGLIETVATDLEAFSRHAGRTRIDTDDVLLLARRNQDLYNIMKEFIDKQKAAKGKGKGKQ
jgi:centromere protein S